MRDLIIGFIIGVLASTLFFSTFSHLEKLTRLEEKQKTIITDIEKINQHIGPLKGGKK